MNPAKHVIDDHINQFHDQDNDELNVKVKIKNKDIYSNNFNFDIIYLMHLIE